METKEKFRELIQEILKQEEAIKSHLIALANEGIKDEELESYLKVTLIDFESKRNSIQQEFQFNFIPTAPTTTSKKPLTPTSYQKTETDPVIPLKIIPQLEIFKKKISPIRGTSPSALRYSPIQSPVSERIERNRVADIFSNTQSPIPSTRSSGSSIDKASIFLPSNEFNPKLMKKYQYQREIRNNAHEKMLLIKEKILLDKEKKIYSLIKAAEIKDLKTLNFDKNFFDGIVSKEDCNRNKYRDKPPKSPPANKNKANSKPSNKIVIFI